MFNKKKVGLVLGGGAAKGFAHIGVLKVLEQNNIPIDMVSGTSMGSVIGALYCIGYSTLEIEKIARETPWKKLVDLAIPKRGLIKGDKLENYLRHLFEDKTFTDLKKPLLVTATDIQTGEEIVFEKGDLTKAVRASISIPGIFNPVENNGRILVDGGVLDNLPIDILRKKGAEIIIAVSLFHTHEKNVIYEEAIKQENNKKAHNLFSTLLNTFNLFEEDTLRLMLHNAKADVIITPDLTDIKLQDFDKLGIGVKNGEAEANKFLDKIKSLTAEKTIIQGIIDIIKN